MFPYWWYALGWKQAINLEKKLQILASWYPLVKTSWFPVFTLDLSHFQPFFLKFFAQNFCFTNYPILLKSVCVANLGVVYIFYVAINNTKVVIPKKIKPGSFKQCCYVLRVWWRAGNRIPKRFRPLNTFVLFLGDRFLRYLQMYCCCQSWYHFVSCSSILYLYDRFSNESRKKDLASCKGIFLMSWITFWAEKVENRTSYCDWKMARLKNGWDWIDGLNFKQVCSSNLREKLTVWGWEPADI